MSLLFEPSTSSEAHKMILSAKNDINEYLQGIDEKERVNVLSCIEVRDYTQNGECYTLDQAPTPEIELVT